MSPSAGGGDRIAPLELIDYAAELSVVRAIAETRYTSLINFCRETGVQIEVK